LNQDEASVKQENKNITPEPWQEGEAGTGIVNILKTHHSGNKVGFCHNKTRLNGFVLQFISYLHFPYYKIKPITKETSKH
jgi:hypothetical protein